jgi:hypothetical protein
MSAHHYWRHKEMTTNTITYDIPDFCYHHKISRSLFYKLRKLKLAPKMMRVGNRVLITEDSAKEWRKQMEQKTMGDK